MFSAELLSQSGKDGGIRAPPQAHARQETAHPCRLLRAGSSLRSRWRDRLPSGAWERGTGQLGHILWGCLLDNDSIAFSPNPPEPAQKRPAEERSKPTEVG